MRKTSFISKFVFKTIRKLVKLFYGKSEVIGIEKINKSNTVIVANHSQMNGPIVAELYFPENCYIWCAGEMMNIKEVPQYAFNDFWSQKPGWTRPFYKILSVLIAPLSSCIFNNARTISVYHDSRILSTFRESIDMLNKGNNIIIFPEKDENNNNIINKFQEHFIDIARIYYRRSGIELTFLPVYIAPTLKKAYICEEIKYNSQNNPDDERKRISDYISKQITDMARALPEHIVVPYRNIPKKRYISNKKNDEVPK